MADNNGDSNPSPRSNNPNRDNHEPQEQLEWQISYLLSQQTEGVKLTIEQQQQLASLTRRQQPPLPQIELQQEEKRDQQEQLRPRQQDYPEFPFSHVNPEGIYVPGSFLSKVETILPEIDEKNEILEADDHAKQVAEYAAEIPLEQTPEQDAEQQPQQQQVAEPAAERVSEQVPEQVPEDFDVHFPKLNKKVQRQHPKKPRHWKKR